MLGAASVLRRGALGPSCGSGLSMATAAWCELQGRSGEGEDERRDSRVTSREGRGRTARLSGGRGMAIPWLWFSCVEGE